VSPEPAETWHPDTRRVGRRVFVFDALDSTNDAAAGFAADPANDGLVVLARHQTGGRGQYGRVWAAPPGSAVLLSVLVLVPPPELRRPVILTAGAAVAVGEAIRQLTGVQAKIKWPNDLLVRGKKVCGILIEQAAGTVVGIGLNVNQSADDFARAGLPDATSLALVAGALLDPETAARVLIRQLDDEYDRLLAGERIALEADWKWRIGLLGRQVEVELADGSLLAGRLRDMAFDGLELEEPGGFVRVVRPEAIRHLRGT
jgi:BirA family biotin operon repressor/biotin-[acetyl-CoA-carboxylase] ligase